MTTSSNKELIDRSDEPRRNADSAHEEIKRHSAGQRRVNLLWEGTQASIAVAVTGSTLYVAVARALAPPLGGPVDSSTSLLLSSAFFLVIGFYFGRTNHTKVGGVVGRPDER